MQGEAVLLNGETTRPLRTEAQARAKRKFYAGERFEQAERRWFRDDRFHFDLAISSAVAAMENANMTPEQIQIFRDHVSDSIGDTWAVDYRAEDE